MKHALLAGLAVMVIGLTVPQAQANSFTLTLTQQGSSVIASGSGAIDLTGLTLDYPSTAVSCPTAALLAPSDGASAAGGANYTGAYSLHGCSPTLDVFADGYSGPATGPATFGTGTFAFADPFTYAGDSNSGDYVGFYPRICLLASCSSSDLANLLYVPQGYVSDSPLSNSATWSNTSFTSIGITPGVYTWSWGTGADQRYTLDAMTPATSTVPESSSLSLLLGGLLAMGLVLLRRKQT